MNQFKTIAVFVSMLFMSSLNAQNIGHTYNKYINKAEVYITENNYKKALQQYDEAFATTKVEFATDIYNACASAVKLKDTKKVLFFADKLAAKGIGAKYFSKAIFKGYIDNADFKKV